MALAKLLLLLALSTATLAIYSKEYHYRWKKHKLIELEEFLIMGSAIPQTHKDKQANQILMNYKHAEYDAGIHNPEIFLPSMHFFNSKTSIEESPVYNILKMLPKGASLHSHLEGMVSVDFLVSLTYAENLYGCTQNDRLRLHFFSTPDNTCNWETMAKLREENSAFDDYVREQLTLMVPDPCDTYPSQSHVWATFSNILITTLPLITYRPIWKRFFYQALQELYDDNSFYLEFRTALPTLYDLDGTTYNSVECAGVLFETLQEFKSNNTDFLGARFIYAPARGVNNATAQHYVTTAVALKKQFPTFFAGFDLVGCEDLGPSLESFLTQLEGMKKHGIKFFFHAGETALFGTSVDFNLFDAIMLGTQRIGGAQALIKHPEIMKLVKLKRIGIEVLPISGQVLKIVGDFRNDPANYLIAKDYPVVLGNDYPGVFGGKALSYDWYIAFMGMTSRNADMKVLKKLALNSIEFSAMTMKEKLWAVADWTKRFELFCAGLIELNSAVLG